MKELIVLIGWYNEVDPAKIKAFEENKRTFELSNPDVEVITVINTLDNLEDKKKAWLCSDIPMYEWYLKNSKKHPAKRYLLVEWDCWCDIDLHEYFGRVWDCDLVVPSVMYPERDAWCWFASIKLLPPAAAKYAVGVVPFCGILIANKAFKKICKEILKPEYMHVISELRLGTVATMLGIDPVPNSVANRILGWRGVSPFDKKHKGLHHPRKTL
ncbi:hypothetical protein ABIB40_003332 [Pedobacter sp. UYP30]|uniref:hypothetical protein n=1 Tax=Pedobacter sp. UYP30 TaxID=1756400 RepID=UPI003396864F